MGKDIQQEFFELRLGIKGYSISTYDLIAYLSDTNKLITSINQTLNTKYAIGFDQIEIDVVALEKGSFKIPLYIKKITENPTISSIVGSVFGALISGLLSNNQEAKTIQYGTDKVIITNDELLKNRATANAVGNIARMAVESDNINDLSVTYEKTNGEKEQIVINKRTLSQVMYEVPEDESISNIVTNATLEIVSPVFVDKPATWKVAYDGNQFTAQMTDEDFLGKMNLQKLSFAPGDVIIADMEVVAKTTERGIRLKHYIRKVHKYPKFSRIIRNEPILFDEVKE
ncbi:MAG: hypothetical protein U0L16_09070 [Phocaeicola sp.]|nr:hypothetical protein [Phocaeicola sp.]